MIAHSQMGAAYTVVQSDSSLTEGCCLHSGTERCHTHRWVLTHRRVLPPLAAQHHDCAADHTAGMGSSRLLQGRPRTPDHQTTNHECSLSSHSLSTALLAVPITRVQSPVPLAHASLLLSTALPSCVSLSLSFLPLPRHLSSLSNQNQQS